MNINKSTGESSLGQENGDASTSSERPLKKARFPWQVKGKHHLKNKTDECNKSLSVQSSGASTSKPSSTRQSSIAIRNEGEDFHRNPDDGQSDTVINPDGALFAANSSKAEKQQLHPKYTYERTPIGVIRTEIASDEFVMRPEIKEQRENQCVAQWQARQVMNSHLDNSLNVVLESWSKNPVTGEGINSTILAHDFAEFINHLPGDNTVENEAILMAISAHGLQNPLISSRRSSNTARNVDNTSSSSTPYCITSPLPTRSLRRSHDDSLKTTGQECDSTVKFPDDEQDQHGDNQNANGAYYSERSQSPYNFYDDNHPNSNTDASELEDQIDFINAAVIFAIQTKGLKVSSANYGC